MFSKIFLYSPIYYPFSPIFPILISDVLISPVFPILSGSMLSERYVEVMGSCCYEGGDAHSMHELCGSKPFRYGGGICGL